MTFFLGFPIKGDLELNADGSDFVLVTGGQQVVQAITNRAQIFKGSWTYDRSLGVPYFQDVLASGASIELVRRRFYELVAETPGISSVVSVTLRFDHANETIYVDFSAVAEGQIISGSLDFVAT